jgi:hypothetical protein
MNTTDHQENASLVSSNRIGAAVNFKLATVLATSMFCAHLFAAPAPWYKWRSKVDGKEFCSQISPGEGWERLAIPYKDARCEKPADR